MLNSKLVLSQSVDFFCSLLVYTKYTLSMPCLVSASPVYLSAKNTYVVVCNLRFWNYVSTCR